MSENTPDRNAGDQAKAAGMRHGQIHPQIEEHFHGHYHGQISPHIQLDVTRGAEHRHYAPHADPRQQVLTIRSYSGISGDMLLCGFGVLACQAQNIDPENLQGVQMCVELCSAILPDLAGCLSLRPHKVAGITGWQAEVKIPDGQHARNLADIKSIIKVASIGENAKKRAATCFELLATCEAAVHNVGLEDIHFHEVGALDSILDICGTCELYERLGSPTLVCSPLPVADGQISCAHGILPAPAPASLRLLENIPLRPFEGEDTAGELLTPTGIALLRALNAQFGKWPYIRLQRSVTVYGQREFADAPNGVTFASGIAW